MYIRNLAVFLSAVCILPSAGWAQSDLAKGASRVPETIERVTRATSKAIGRAAPKGVRYAGANPFRTSTFTRMGNQRAMDQATTTTRKKLWARLNQQILTKSDVADMQFQVLKTSWSEEEFRLVALKYLPILPWKHNYSLLPSLQEHAVGVYRNVIADYKGASSFAQEKDLESWAQMISAVSNLGFFGVKQDADILVKVYEKVPPQAKKVTALAINRALLCLDATEENALFSQLAAEDGVLSEEFALGMENRTEAVSSSPQEEEKMRQAVAKFHPVATLHFNPSSEVTTQWMVLNQDIRRAEDLVDWRGFTNWQEGQLANLDIPSLNEILTRPDSPYFQDLSQQEAANWVHAARIVLARKFEETYPQLAEEVDVYEVAQNLDFNGVSNPWEKLHEVVEKEVREKNRKYLEGKRSEFTELLDNLVANVENFSTVQAEFVKLFEQFPEYDWGNLPNRFAEAEDRLPVVRLQKEGTKKEEFTAFLEKDVTVLQLRDAMVTFKTRAAQKIYNWEDLPFLFYKKINNVLLSAYPPRTLAEEKAVEELIGYQADFYRSALSVPLYKSKITSADASTWERLKNKFPNSGNDDISALVEQRIEEDNMLRRYKQDFRSEYASFDKDFWRWRKNFDSYLSLKQIYPDYRFGVGQSHFENQRRAMLTNALPPRIDLEDLDNGGSIDSEPLWKERRDQVYSLAEQYNTRRVECLIQLYVTDVAYLEETVKLRRAELKKLYDDVLSRDRVLREDMKAAVAKQKEAAKPEAKAEAKPETKAEAKKEEAAKQKENIFSRWWKWLRSH